MEAYSVDRYKACLIGIELECFEGWRRYYATILHNGTCVHTAEGYNPEKLLAAMKLWVDNNPG